jgi:hypothetical protein
LRPSKRPRRNDSRGADVARGPLTFRQQDVTRALRAAVAAGLDVKGYEIDKAGKIVVIIGKPEEPTGAGNPWDSVVADLDNQSKRM